MRPRPGPIARFILCTFFLLLSSRAITLDEIENTPQLTPERFAGIFKNFEFKFHSEIQSPEVFLETKSGDCDDYAILAARIFKSRGYTPRLIAVRMPKLVHVVCYIPETNSYLDYNNRSATHGAIRCSADIREIAAHVAQSYRQRWSSASEFVYQGGSKRLVETVLGSDHGQLATILP